MLTLGPLALQYLVIYSFFLFQDDDEDFLVENEEEVDVKELDVPKATSSKEYLGKLQYKVRFTLFFIRILSSKHRSEQNAVVHFKYLQ